MADKVSSPGDVLYCTLTPSVFGPFEASTPKSRNEVFVSFEICFRNYLKEKKLMPKPKSTSISLAQLDLI